MFIRELTLIFSSNVTQMRLMKNKSIPSRLLVRTEDLAFRLVSPSTGKFLTTVLPIVETDYVIDFAYSAKMGIILGFF